MKQAIIDDSCKNKWAVTKTLVWGLFFPLPIQYFMEFHVRVLLPTPLPSPWSNQNRTSFCPAVYQNHYMYLCNIPCIYLYDICSNYMYTQVNFATICFMPAWQCTLVWMIKDQRWFAYASCLLPTYIIPYYTRSFDWNPVFWESLSKTEFLSRNLWFICTFDPLQMRGIRQQSGYLGFVLLVFFTLVSFDSSPLSR